MRGKIATWWMPDDVVFVDEIPHTATGKIQKMTLRERFKDYRAADRAAGLIRAPQGHAPWGPLPRPEMAFIAMDAPVSGGRVSGTIAASLRKVRGAGDGTLGVTAMTMALTRRRMAEEPLSQLAIWARRLAIFALLVAVLAIGIEQWGALEIIPVLVTFGSALALALLAILVAIAAFVMLWINGGPGAGAAITGVVISLMLLGYPAYLGYLAYTLPAIKDITTDPIDPPRFEVVARLRPPNSSAYPGLATAELQKDAYPDVEPLLVKVTPAAAYDHAMKVIDQAQMAGVRCPPAAARPRRPYRGDRALADHGLPRRRGGAHPRRPRRRPRRCPLGLALRLHRFRRQCRAGGSAARRDRRPRQHTRAPAEGGEAAREARPEETHQSARPSGSGRGSTARRRSRRGRAPPGPRDGRGSRGPPRPASRGSSPI